MLINLPNIQAPCSPVVGGIANLNLIPCVSVVSIPEAVNYIIEDQVSLVNGALIANISFPQNAGEFTEDQADNDSGDFYKQKLSVFIPKDRPDITSFAARAAKIKYFIGIYTDNNGYSKLVGSLEYPLKFSSSGETGKAARDKSGLTISLTGQSPDKAFYYLDNPEQPQPGGGGSGDPVTILKGNGEVVALVQPGQSFVINSGFSWGFNII